MEDMAAAPRLLRPLARQAPPERPHQSLLHPVRALGHHSAQQLPLPRRQPAREALKYDYLLFFSNFNGTWNQYIDAFSAVLSKGLNLIWRWSEKFPGSVPVTPFKQYIAHVQFDTDYYYTAYPQATANDVKAAHIVQQALDTLRSKAESLTPEQFQQAYLQFVLTVQSHLGATGEAPPVF